MKYTSKTPDTVGYIRRMRSIDFPELRALRMNLFFAGVHTEKQNKTKQNENKNTHPIKTVDDLKRNTNLVALGI